ncbi:MAG: SPOR domain-containing protein [Pseudomonadota bacterium]
MHNNLLPPLLASIVSLALYVYNTELNIRLDTFENITSTQSDELTEMQPRVFAFSVQQVAEDLAVPETEPAAVHAANTEPEKSVTAEVSTITVADTQTSTRAVTNQKTLAINNETVAIANRPESQGAVPDIQSDPVPVAEGPAPVVSESVPDKMVITSEPEDGGPWVINLISSRDRTYVSSYADRALAKGIPAEINNAEVKGREYWRLQLKGFQTMAEAKYFSGSVKEKLGLKDVWIFKRS